MLEIKIFNMFFLENDSYETIEVHNYCLVYSDLVNSVSMVMLMSNGSFPLGHLNKYLSFWSLIP